MEALRVLDETWGEISDLAAASALLGWDQETGMPRQGVEARGSALGTLAGLIHERLAGRRLGDSLAELEDRAADIGPDRRAMVREARRDHDRATRIPADLVKRLAEEEARAMAAWQEARAESRFERFLPHLTTLLDLKIQVADALGWESERYDALLDEYERGATAGAVGQLFLGLRAELLPLVRAIAERGSAVDLGPVLRPVPAERQLEFGRTVARAMGFDFGGGRIDRSAHPFCTKIHAGDVRLTWRAAEADVRPALFGIIHEAGHGLYEQGLPPHFGRTPLGEAASLGIHESQSRLWENMVARSRPFWSNFLPELKRQLPGSFDDVDVEAMYRAVNHVAPSLIRVEADEFTYNLHVILRFEIERDLLQGRLAVRDLPQAWNARMQEFLGVVPDRDAQGVLQDIHWSMGAFGYFPTYTLGNLYAAQLMQAARADLGDLDDQIARGELGNLREWLREKVHAHGRQHLPAELIAAATGRKPAPDAFLAYARSKARDVYGV